MNGHGGNLHELARAAGCEARDILDFSANINPLGPPSYVRATIARAVEDLAHYPDPHAAELVAAIAKRYGVPCDYIVPGNGTSELLYAIPAAVGARRAIIPVPSYVDYANAAKIAGLEVHELALREDDDFALRFDAISRELRGGEIVFLGQPNNPTGRMFDVNEFRAFAASHRDSTFVVDEAFAGFVEGYTTLCRDLPPNVIVLCSLTKLYAIPGLRLGFAAASAELAAKLRNRIAPWSVNTLAQRVGAAVLDDDGYLQETRQFVAPQRQSLIAGLRAVAGLHVYDSAANFLLVRLDRRDAFELRDRLLRQAIAIRIFGPGQYLDRRYFRVAVRCEEENARLIAAVGSATQPPASTARADSAVGGVADHSSRSRSASEPNTRGGELCHAAARLRTLRSSQRAAAIMFQGTSSNAGKSILTAALCRILLQDGVRVAPFKSQNMSLNSFVTRDQGEMGRAQVVQAQACRLDPDVRMNPILLKPNSDTGSQVIVRGRPVGNMRVAEYVRYKPEAFAAAKECYDSLAREFDVIVMEGAGSPGEVNLKSHDIVNMRMAEYAGAPVLIVGDIDRGGVFASFVGTMEVLDEWERKLVAGWVVNRFRGDASLLKPALDYTWSFTGRPVIGVVPFLKNLDIPQEDSVEFKSGALDAVRADAPIEIAVIDLPHISNFTDFDAFAVEPDVRLRIVRPGDELGTPDAVILPGSKNTLADLAYLRSSGLAGKIGQCKAELLGICGGFQMLGREIRDPHRLESAGGSARGLAMLAVDTTLEPEKTLLRCAAKHIESGLDVVGYEIHHGQTNVNGSTVAFRRADGEAIGAASADGRVWGTYMHGVFDADEFRRYFVDRLRRRRGLSALGGVGGRYSIESTLDRLADVVRTSLDMQQVYRLLKLK